MSLAELSDWLPKLSTWLPELSLPWLPANPTNVQLTLWACAIGGTLFFLLRVMLILVGGFGDDLDISADADGADGDLNAHDGAHTEAAFKILSLNTIGAFVMMFGWTGMTAHLQFQLSASLSIVIAFAVGLFAMFLTAWMFKSAMRLASSGADFRIEEIVGQKASVYQRIPAGGRGVIRLSVNGMLRELNAQSGAKQEVPSFTTVKITKIIDSNTVNVETVRS